MFDVLNFVAFEIFTQTILAVMFFILGIIYAWKRFNQIKVIPRMKQGYIVKAFNWFVLSFAFAIFVFLPLTEGRAILRISIAFLAISELAFQWYYIKLIAADVYKWTQTSLRLL